MPEFSDALSLQSALLMIDLMFLPGSRRLHAKYPARTEGGSVEYAHGRGGPCDGLRLFKRRVAVGRSWNDGAGNGRQQPGIGVQRQQSAHILMFVSASHSQKVARRPYNNSRKHSVEVL